MSIFHAESLGRPDESYAGCTQACLCTELKSQTELLSALYCFVVTSRATVVRNVQQAVEHIQ